MNLELVKVNQFMNQNLKLLRQLASIKSLKILVILESNR